MKIKIKQIVRWEQLMNKPFYELDPTSDLEITALMYVTADEKDLDNSTFEIFQQISNKKVCEDLSRSITRYFAYINQFSKNDATEKKEVDPMALDKTEDEAEKKTVRIADIVAGLIFDGVDAHYLLNDAEICDLPMLCKGAEMKMRRDKEDSRLWTFLMLTPYMSENVKKVTDFYPFPWEEEGKPTVISDDDMAMAEAMLNTKEN